ncbi:MAG: HAMP domain-containing histidine kinase [Theionarchaea archaeon]|nr:HAMP domain-containing histidine kinase [Theionarchaea archaeon]
MDNKKAEIHEQHYQFSNALLEGINKIKIEICLIDENYNILYQNVESQNQFGIHIGENFYETFLGKNTPTSKHVIFKSSEEETIQNIEVRAVNNREYHLLCSSIIDKSGVCRKAIILFIDITDTKIVQDALDTAYINYSQEMEYVEKVIKEKQCTIIELMKKKEELFSTMSHEIRTPLNSVISFAELLLLEIDGPLSKGQKKTIEMIRESGNDAVQLFEQYFMQGRESISKFYPKPNHLDVSEVISYVASQLQVKTLKKGISLKTCVQKNLPLIRCDRITLKQILRNLVNNAIKYTFKGEIIIGAKKNGSNIKDRV